MSSYGIDFGTTNSVLARYTPAGVEVLPVDRPPAPWADMGFDAVLPSVLAVERDRSMVFGWAAKQRTAAKLEAVKRLFATDELVRIGDEELSVEHAATLLFGHLRAAVPGTVVDRAVVTVPANSLGLARFRTKLCAGLAGIEVPALINEPTAAAMAFSLTAARDQTVLVFDWGGGTLDVTVLETVEGVFMERASKGVGRLGGVDLDRALAEAVLRELPDGPGWGPADKAAFTLDVERAKIELASCDEVAITLPDDRPFTVTRTLLERALAPLLVAARGPIEQCLADLSMGPGDVDQLVMVGGTSKLPMVRAMAEQAVGREAAPGCDPMTAVAQGAAVASAILAGEVDLDFFVSTEHALGTIVAGEGDRRSFSVLIPRNHQLPATATESYVPRVQGQASVRLEVLEGDPEHPVDHADNVVLKTWVVDVDPTVARQDSAFSLTYSYDVDGILRVVAVDHRTGRELLRDDVSFGISRDPASLVDLSRTVREELGEGRLTSGRPHPDPQVADLVERFRTKVAPFVGIPERSRLESLAVALEHARESDRPRLVDEFRTELRAYSYLF